LLIVYLYGILDIPTAGTEQKGTTMAPDDLLTTAQVRAILGISKVKMARLIAAGELHTQPDPLDGRVKLIRRSEVDALIARSSKKAA
jgi:hypothetical protein